MPDDLTRRAIIAAHNAQCTCESKDQHDDYGEYRGLTVAERAIVEAWRADREQLLSHDTAATIRALTTRVNEVEAELERLRDWKQSAMTVMSGLQDFGTELGLPLGESITGTLAAETAHRLRVRAETAEAEVERLRTVTGMADEQGARILAERNEAQAAIKRVRAVLGDAHEVIDRGGIRREAYIPADRVRAALDDQEATDGGAP